MKKKLSKFGKLPINARITVDYSKKKPKISFGYIAKKQQSSLNYVNLISMVITMVIMMVALWFLTNMPNSNMAPLIGTCGVYEQHYLGDNQVAAYNISCGGGIISYIVEYKPGTGLYPLGNAAGFYPTKTSKLQNLDWFSSIGKPWYINLLLSSLALIIVLLVMIATVVFLFGVSYFFGWVIQFIPYFNKVTNRLIPEINKKLTSVRYMATFKTCPEDKIIEIPLFKNIFLDYDAKGDFSKYLQRVEIREHPFSMLSKRYYFKNRRQKQKYKKRKNIFLWKARFIFKEIPKKGQLEVRWS